MSGIDVTIGPTVWVDQLTERLPRMTDRIRSERIVTEAIMDGLKARKARREVMALADKAAHFADRLKQAPKRVEEAFDGLIARIDAMENNAVESVAAATKVVDDAEAGIRAVQDIVNQLSNGDESNPTSAAL